MANIVRPNLIERLNRSATLELLREQGPLSRAKIAQVLHLSPATVTRIVSRLVEESLVLEIGVGDSTGGADRLFWSLIVQPMRSSA